VFLFQRNENKLEAAMLLLPSIDSGLDEQRYKTLSNIDSRIRKLRYIPVWQPRVSLR